jgi:predicted DNA-binding transcriptional regulator AlpA
VDSEKSRSELVTAHSDYITKAQYAKITGVGRSTVTYWIDTGSLPASCLVLAKGKQMIDLKQVVALGIFEKHNRGRFSELPNLEIPNPGLKLEIEDEEKQAAETDHNTWWAFQGNSNSDKPRELNSSTNERFISKIQYAQTIGVAPSLITKWLLHGEIPSSCLVTHEGREKIDLEKMRELGVLERHSLRKSASTSEAFTFKATEQIPFAEQKTPGQIPSTEQKTTEQIAFAGNEQNQLTEQPEVLGKVLSLQSKIAANDSAKPPMRHKTKTEQEIDFFEEERRARLQKIKADAAIADMNQKRAEGKLLDADKFEDLVVDLFSSFNTYFAQFSEQSAASLYGLNDLQSMKSILDQRLDAMRERIREEIERKKMEAQRLIALQTKPLKF